MNLENPIALDCENYPNHFLISFKSCDGSHRTHFELRGESANFTRAQIAEIDAYFNEDVTTFGFNSLNYDLPLIALALDGATAKEICDLGNDIIKNRKRSWQVLKEYGLADLSDDHFDLFEVAPGVRISLKTYGARMFMPRLQDLPVAPNTTLTAQEMDTIKSYCENDLDTTIELYNQQRDQIQLRHDMSEQYDTNLMSKSDAQIAEAVIKAELGGKVKRPQKIPESVAYRAPEFIKFENEDLQGVLEQVNTTVFKCNRGNGSVILPKALRENKITIGKSTYQMGIGGLHSTEKSQSVVPNANQLLCDRDVASYYPNIILNLGFAPKTIGPKFQKIYKSIVDRRIEAKRNGDKVTANSLKITVNGSFGKLGSKYSFLYAPALMLATTITGQLSLLMLIERLEKAGMSVVSANTDGFVTLMDKDQWQLYDDICFAWELDTNFELEETRYAGLYSRDVNNYLALTTDFECKGKGVFADDGLLKTPVAPICRDAVKTLIMYGDALEQTIDKAIENGEIERFTVVRNATGGAEWGGVRLGKVARWIYHKEGKPIKYVKSGNKVATSDGAWPVMDLPHKVPDGLDKMKYAEMCRDMMKDLGL